MSMKQWNKYYFHTVRKTPTISLKLNICIHIYESFIYLFICCGIFNYNLSSWDCIASKVRLTTCNKLECYRGSSRSPRCGSLPLRLPDTIEDKFCIPLRTAGFRVRTQDFPNTEAGKLNIRQQKIRCRSHLHLSAVCQVVLSKSKNVTVPISSNFRALIRYSIETPRCSLTPQIFCFFLQRKLQRV